jgi:5-keto 4-deoxyuronate isomerase
MKKFLFSSFASLFLASSLFAQNVAISIVSTNLTSASTNLLAVGALRVNQLQISAGSQPVTLTVYDSGVNSNYYLMPAYVGYTNYVTNVVTTYISPLTLTTNVQTNSMIVGYNVTNSASTNLYPSYTFLAAANTLATYPVSILTTRGLVVVNNTNCTVSASYYGNQ